MTGLINVSTYIAAAAWAIFVVWYQLRARWWATPTGRNVMAVAVAILAMLALATLARLNPDWAGRPVVQLFVYLGVAALGVQRTVQLERVQRHADRGHVEV